MSKVGNDGECGYEGEMVVKMKLLGGKGGRENLSFESQEMSTSNVHQQSLADAGSETRPLMVKRGTIENVQCYNCSEKGHYARNYPKPRVKDSKYFMEQMLLAKQDEARVILTDEHSDFLFADAS
nr:hypothetical protein [Tanacetum cinerariifolium]